MLTTFNGIRPGDKVTFTYTTGFSLGERKHSTKTAQCIMAFAHHVIVQHTGNGYYVDSENYSGHTTTKPKKLPPCSVPTQPFNYNR